MKPILNQIFTMDYNSAMSRQPTVSQSQRAALPPPGRLVDVGGLRLHLLSQGAGSPTVLLEAGLTENHLTWSLVQPEMARFTRVLSYDRAGLGWSDPSPRPRTSTVIVDELQRLLHAAGIGGPFILVGASLGGIHVRTFANRHPQQVAGMVLVDSVHDSYWRRMSDETYQAVRRSQALELEDFKTLAAMTPARLQKTLNARRRRGEKSPFPPEVQALIADRQRPETMTGAVRELAALEIISTMTQDGNFFLGDTPLVILTAGVIEPDASLSEEQNAEVDRVWAALQREMLSFSNHGRQVVVEDSGHSIQVDQPQAVIAAVRSLVEACRRKGGASG